jgi:hypothetical protein
MNSLLNRLRQVEGIPTRLASTGQRQEARGHRLPPDAPLQRPALKLEIPNAPAHGLRIALVMDTQVKEDVETGHIKAYGRYIADKQPDVIVCIGDWWDFPSLSFHNKPGSIEREGRRYNRDFDAGRAAMDLFLNEIAKAKGYNPTKVFTLGNHDILPSRQAAEDTRLIGTLIDPTKVLHDHGWLVYDFLQPVSIAGVAFSHFFPSGPMSRPIVTARSLLSKLHMSAVAGHQQGRDIAQDRRADGSLMTAIISGSFYQHDERYLSPFANGHWRGTWFMHQVKDGSFDEMPLSLDFFKRKFG